MGTNGKTLEMMEQATADEVNQEKGAAKPLACQFLRKVILPVGCNRVR